MSFLKLFYGNSSTEQLMGTLDNLTQSLSYSDLGLVPRQISDTESRNQVDASTEFCGEKLKIPVVAAPMKTVCGAKMANALRQCGAYGILYRTNDRSVDYAEYLASLDLKTSPAVSIGVTGDFLERFLEFRSYGANVFCLDTANGFHTNVGAAVQKIRLADSMESYPTKKPLYLIAGNIASWEGYEFLEMCGVDAVRVGIGNGSLCTTSIATGVGQGQASLIREIHSKRTEPGVPVSKKWPALIADGGIREPGDVCKALALGADVVMLGSMLAGTEESPGEVVPFKDRPGLAKKYFGEASAESKGNENYVEGASTYVEYKGSVSNVLKRVEEGLKSSMAYMGCRTLDEFRKLPDACWVKLSHNARLERLPHLLLNK